MIWFVYIFPVQQGVGNKINLKMDDGCSIQSFYDIVIL